MISYKDRATVKRLAQQYRMPESYIREILAIESGASSGDVTEVERRPARHGWLRQGSTLLVNCLCLGLPVLLRDHR